jgi:hypothetical protein
VSLGEEERDNGCKTHLQIVNELFQVFNRVDIVVRRGRDETDTSSRVTSTSDRFRDFVAGKLSSFSRLRTLSHLDLKLVGVSEVVRGNTEASRGDLLDSRAHRVSVRHDFGSFGVFSSFSRVRFSSLLFSNDVSLIGRV